MPERIDFFFSDFPLDFQLINSFTVVDPTQKQGLFSHGNPRDSIRTILSHDYYDSLLTGFLIALPKASFI